MPLTHDMGLIGFHLMMVLAGMDHTIIATEAFIRRPMRWIRAASDYRATVLCSPNFGFSYLLKSFAPEKARDIDLSPVRIIFNGAEPISAHLCERFLDALAQSGLRRTAMYPVYGLAEASLAVSFPSVGEMYRTLSVSRDRLGPGERIELDDRRGFVTLVSVGRAIGKCEVRIGTDAGSEMPPDTVGRILIRGPNVTEGFYMDGRTLNREAFVEDGWLDTGDLGFIHAGELYITGRTKDVIFVNGQNYYAHDIEAIAADIEGLELGKVVASGCRSDEEDSDELVLFVLFRGNASDFAELARRAGRKVSEDSLARVAVAVPVNNIPKTTSGKLRRFSLKAAYERGDFRDSAIRLAEPSETAGEVAGTAPGTEAFLRDLFTDVLGGVVIGRDDSLLDIGVGSLKIIEMHERIEEHFPGRIQASDLIEYPTLAKLAAHLDGEPGGDG
jgi:acyl-CoA synthetase (AMP-forming)/AMP-acid ligase II